MIDLQQNLESLPKLELNYKALGLAKLAQNGYLIPQTIVLESSDLDQIWQTKSLDLSFFIQIFGKSKLAVRSNMSTEDAQNSSMAGQFLTILDIEIQDLADSVLQVIQSGFEKGLKMAQIGVIVQEYITADISGVCFTTDPQNYFRVLFEYHSGAGEALVSGKITPNQKSFSSFEIKQGVLKKYDFPLSLSQTQAFLNLEKIIGCPQDIEWVLSQNQLYFLQSRTITSWDENQLESYQYLKEKLKLKSNFYYYQNDLSDLFKSATEANLNLIQGLYSAEGPIAQAYRKYGIFYQSEPFWEVFGNQIWIDRDLEKQTLFPTNGNGMQKILNFGLKINNILALNSFKIVKFEILLQKLVAELSVKSEEKIIFKKMMESFYKSYTLVFEINLCTSVVQSRLESFLRSLKLDLSQVLELDFGFEFWEKLDNLNFILNAKNMLGNTIDLTDLSEFSTTLVKPKQKEISKLPNWWQKLPQWQQITLKPRIQELQFWFKLREMGRWLAIQKLSPVKKTLADDLKKVVAVEAGNYAKLVFAEIITDQEFKIESEIKQVSAGIAEGVLIQDLSQINSKTKTILYTEQLSPDLAVHLPHISGIISRRGGYLSHLSILAREAKIPVLVGVDLATSGLKIGDQVRIKRGEVEKIAFR
jgi:phosphohistidine swiveling domain-containing protein